MKIYICFTSTHGTSFYEELLKRKKEVLYITLASLFDSLKQVRIIDIKSRMNLKLIFITSEFNDLTANLIQP